MQRRMIYAQLAENKDFAKMSDKAQKTYIFLIVLADDEGRVKGDSDWLRIKIFPYDTEVSVDYVKGYLKEIIRAGLIRWYKKGSDYFIEHPNWTKYQILRTDRKKASMLPSPDDNQVTTKRVHKRSKLSKRREVNNNLSYLEDIPELDLDDLFFKYEGSKAAIKSKAEDLANYCKKSGKTYKDYKAFLEVVLKKDFGKRKEPPKKMQTVEDGSIRLVEITRMSDQLGNKFKENVEKVKKTEKGTS